MVSRIIELLINDSLIAYLLKHDLNYTEQHGFLRKKSCASCLNCYLNYNTKSLNTGRPVTVIFLDRTGAFDGVPRRWLLHKMESLGLVDPILSWLSSYM